MTGAADRRDHIRAMLADLKLPDQGEDDESQPTDHARKRTPQRIRPRFLACVAGANYAHESILHRSRGPTKTPLPAGAEQGRLVLI